MLWCWVVPSSLALESTGRGHGGRVPAEAEAIGGSQGVGRARSWRREEGQHRWARPARLEATKYATPRERGRLPCQGEHPASPSGSWVRTTEVVLSQCFIR